MNMPGVQVCFGMYEYHKGKKLPPDFDHNSRYIPFLKKLLPSACSALDLATHIIAAFKVQAVLYANSFQQGKHAAQFIMAPLRHKSEKAPCSALLPLPCWVTCKPCVGTIVDASGS
jgi:hypothetical protein